MNCLLNEISIKDKKGKTEEIRSTERKMEGIAYLLNILSRYPILTSSSHSSIRFLVELT
jgi:hypothetical protein